MASNLKHLSSYLSDGRTVPGNGSPYTELLDEQIDNNEINLDVLKIHLNTNVDENKIREWEEQKNCELEVSCGEFETKVHSDILSSVSDYFNSRSNFNKQARKCVLSEECVSSEAMCHVIKFAYSGDLEIARDKVEDLLETASYLRVELILDECEKFLINSIDHSTAMSLLPSAIQFNLMNLIATIVMYISENFDTFVQQNLFYTLSNEEFKFLLMQRNLSVFRKGIPVNNPELHILEAVGKRLTAKQVKDYPTVLYILYSILFSEISEDDLSSIYDIYPCFHTIDRSTFTNFSVSDLKFKERKFSNSSKLLESSECYIQASHLKSEKSFEKVSAINDRPKKISLWVTIWERFTVIGGIRVEYHSGTNVLNGIRPKARHSILSEHEFELDEDEVITSINLKSGMLLDSISFDTNYGRTYGPYGGNGGYPSSSSPSQIRCYFHSFRGNVLKGQNYDYYIAITDFTWVVFTEHDTDDYDHYIDLHKFDCYMKTKPKIHIKDDVPMVNMHVKKNATMLNMHAYKNSTMLNMHAYKNTTIFNKLAAIHKMDENMFVENTEDGTSAHREKARDFEDRQSLYYKF